MYEVLAFLLLAGLVIRLAYRLYLCRPIMIFVRRVPARHVRKK